MAPRRRPGALFLSEVEALLDAKRLRQELQSSGHKLADPAFTQLVIELKAAETDYRFIQRVGTTPQDAARTLAELARASGRFELSRRALEAALLALDGRAKTTLASTRRGALRMHGSRRLVTSTVRSAHLRAGLRDLEGGAREAEGQLRRPGRPTDVRRRALAAAVAQALTRTGVKPTTNDTGALAACLTVVFEAAGAKVPQDLVALLRHAVAAAREYQARLQVRG